MSIPWPVKREREETLVGTAVTPSGRWRSRLADAASAVRQRIAGLPAALPAGVREQVGISARRLSKARSLKGAKRVLLEEAERLFWL